MATSFCPQTALLVAFVVISSSLNTILVQATVPEHYVYCYEDAGTYDSNGEYETNLHKALTRLSSRASNTYFSTYRTGSRVDKVSALFSCRYNLSPAACQDCVASSAKKLTSGCISKVEAIIFSLDCTLHYANRQIFKLAEDRPIAYDYKHQSENGQFSQVLATTVDTLIDNTTSSFYHTSRYFGTIEKRYKSQKTIYALAQCNPDITTFACSRCLQSIFDRFSSNFTGVISGLMIAPSCMLTYDLSSQATDVPAFTSAGNAGRLLYGSILSSIFFVISSLMLLI